MTLNIKDPEAHRLAAAIAEITGLSMTRAVTEALRERYDQLQDKRAKVTVEELLRIADRASAHSSGPYIDHADLLYDEHGLPK
jgi:antitoxin VapB